MIARHALLALLAIGLAAPAHAQRTQAPGTQAQGAESQEPEQDSPRRGASRPRKPAASKPKPGAASGLPGGGQATLVTTFGEWQVFQGQAGGAKLCYAASQPKDRQPKNLNRDPAYLFVTVRPRDPKGEIAMVLGFAAKEGEAAEAAIGPAAYALITKGPNAWLKNQAEDAAAVAAMQRGGSVVVKAVSGRGNKLTDRYSLTGFGQALERARRECAAGA